jgi:hypothetical protein
MALSLNLHRKNVGNTAGDVNLDVAITPSATPFLESMSTLVLPPVAKFFGDLGTTEIITSNIVDSDPSALRLLANQYLEGQKRIEEATGLVDESIRKRASQDYEESLQVMLQSGANEDSAAFLALGA